MADVSLTLRRPDDWHLHLRDGAVMRAVTPLSSRLYGRVLILAAAGTGDSHFNPLMSLYLTAETSVDEIDRAVESEHVVGVKLYPAGATTNSAAGVSSLDVVMPVLERMAAKELPLMIHGEAVDPGIDIFDREAVFIDQVLVPLRRRLPELRMVLEHVSTKEGVAFVRESQENVAATVTAHHLLVNRNALLAGGLRPHNYCLPILKREEHREALVQAVTSGDTRFFFGSDSAPHLKADKESACGCAGCFTAATALFYLAEIFNNAGAPDLLEGFVALHGASFYRVPPAEEKIQILRVDAGVPGGESITTEDGEIVVFSPDEHPVRWTIVAE